MHKLNFYQSFLKRLRKLIKLNPRLKLYFDKTFKKLKENPFHSSLKTHKVTDKLSRHVYSSRVTKDLRVIWFFDHNEAKLINLINVGGHSGSKRVYK